MGIHLDMFGGGGGSGSDLWAEKLWAMLAETAAQASDRVNLTNGAVEPFMDAGDLTLVNAAVSGGYAANTAAIDFSTGNIPLMTGDSAPSGNAYSDSCYSGYFAYMAFTRSSPTNWASAQTWSSPLKLTYVWPSANQTVASYAMGSESVATQTPTSWQFQISYDGSTWTTVDTQTVSSWATNEVKAFNLSQTYTNVKGVRLAITATQYGQTGCACVSALQVFSYALTGLATITLNPVAISGATAGKIIFRGYNADATAALDVGNTGSNKIEVYPTLSGTTGSALAVTATDLGSNLWRYTSDEFSLVGTTSFGAKFQSFARTVAPNFRIYDAYIIWR